MRANPRNVALVEAVDEILASRSGQSVGVLDDGVGSKLARLLEGRHPRGQVVSVSVTDAPSDMHVGLAASGHFDVLVDDTRHAAREALFEAAFPHLHDGGVYVVRNFRAERAHDGPGILRRVTELVGLKGQRAMKNAPRQERDDLALAAGIGRLVVARQHLLITREGTALAKIAEREVDHLLGLVPSRGQVVAREPASRLETRAELRESPSPRAGQLPLFYDPVPPTLRRYDQVICLPGQVAVQRNTVLPDSYRHIPQKRLVNASLDDIAPGFVMAPDYGDLRRLDGSYYYLDSEYRGHFGHAMTEQVSRLWGWKRAKAADPGLKALLMVKRREPASFEVDLYGAAGIAPEDLIFVQEPVVVEHLVAGTPLFSMPRYVHPMIEETWNEIGRSLASLAPERAYPERIFLARRPKKRQCHNAHEVEELFAGAGFDVVFAEDLSLPEQVRMFREAEAVAGFAGSALFTLCLAETPKHVLVIASESFLAVNEYMISAVRGNRIDIAWCEPDLPRPATGWNKKSFFSSFTFNWDREGQFLKQALESL
jgi:capsular polysaccharide biosynthesis protein